jgi:hypothetical protein
MRIDCVHLPYVQGSDNCKQRNEDRETKRQRDMFDGNSVEAVSLAGQETKSHDAQHGMQNHKGNADSETLITDKNRTRNRWYSKKEKHKAPVKTGMRVNQP